MAEKSGLGVNVREIMTTEVVAAVPEQTVDEVARELTRGQISGMPVLTAAGELVGVVSEYDIITKRGQRVGDIMSRSVISVPDEADVQQVADIMGLHGIGRVPVMRAGAVVGIISRSDMVRLFAEVRWQCPVCGAIERGFARPARCQQCGETALRLEREPLTE